MAEVQYQEQLTPLRHSGQVWTIIHDHWVEILTYWYHCDNRKM